MLLGGFASSKTEGPIRNPSGASKHVDVVDPLTRCVRSRPRARRRRREIESGEIVCFVWRKNRKHQDAKKSIVFSPRLVFSRSHPTARAPPLSLITPCRKVHYIGSSQHTELIRPYTRVASKLFLERRRSYLVVQPWVGEGCWRPPGKEPPRRRR